MALNDVVVSFDVIVVACYIVLTAIDLIQRPLPHVVRTHYSIPLHVYNGLLLMSDQQ